MRYASRSDVTWDGDTKGVKLIGGKGHVLEDDEAIPKKYGIGDGTNDVELLVKETFADAEE
jgi:hypothetical protein